MLRGDERRSAASARCWVHARNRTHTRACTPVLRWSPCMNHWCTYPPADKPGRIVATSASRCRLAVWSVQTARRSLARPCPPPCVTQRGITSGSLALSCARISLPLVDAGSRVAARQRRDSARCIASEADDRLTQQRSNGNGPWVVE